MFSIETVIMDRPYPCTLSKGRMIFELFIETDFMLLEINFIIYPCLMLKGPLLEEQNLKVLW